jgi:hypothetical protein
MKETKKRDYHMSDCALHNAPAEPVGPCDCGLERIHWAIKLRKALLIPGTWKWNSWVRSITGKLEGKF